MKPVVGWDVVGAKTRPSPDVTVTVASEFKAAKASGIGWAGVSAQTKKPTANKTNIRPNSARMARRVLGMAILGGGFHPDAAGRVGKPPARRPQDQATPSLGGGKGLDPEEHDPYDRIQEDCLEAKGGAPDQSQTLRPQGLPGLNPKDGIEERQ